MQQQDIFWSGSSVAAQRGWWLAIEDPVDIGNVTPSQKVEVTDAAQSPHVIACAKSNKNNFLIIAL